MIDPATAREIIVADYAGADVCGSYEQEDQLSRDGIEATLWKRDDELGLCIRGSNDGWDWLRNFRFIPGWTGRGDSGRLYHRGMIGEARVIWAAARLLGLTWIIGHSRGGGVAQIVGSSLAVPTIAFGAPRVLAPLQSQPPGSECVRVLNKGCDPVSRLPFGYSHVGGVRRQSCEGWWFEHKMAEYPAAGWGDMGWPDDEPEQPAMPEKLRATE